MKETTPRAMLGGRIFFRRCRDRCCCQMSQMGRDRGTTSKRFRPRLCRTVCLKPDRLLQVLCNACSGGIRLGGLKCRSARMANRNIVERVCGSCVSSRTREMSPILDLMSRGACLSSNGNLV